MFVGDGRCVICDSFVKPSTVVRVCDECNYGSYAGRCVVCGNVGVADAYYCKECTRLEKDVCVVDLMVVCNVSQGLTYMIYVYNTCMQRDGCPKIINLGSARVDMHYDKKKYSYK